MKTVKSRNPRRAKNSIPVPVGKGAKVMARRKTRNRGTGHRNAPRRTVARRNPHHHHRRRRRNPGETMDILTLAIWGFVGSIGAGLLAPMIPWGQDNPLTRGLVKVGIGLGLLYAFKNKGSMGKGLALGCAISGVSEAASPYLPSSLTSGRAVVAVPINTAALPPAAAAAVNTQMGRNRALGRIVAFPTAGIPGMAGVRRVGGYR